MLAVIIILGLIGVFSIRKVAIAVYQKTGVNTLKGFNKFLWYIEAVLLLMSFGLDTPVVFILLLVGFSVIQFLICMKAGIPAAIIMALLHGVCGALLGLLNVIVFLLGLFTGGGASGLGGLFSFDQSAYEVQSQNESVQADVAAAKERAEQLKKEEQERADAYAQHQGFRDAEDAERTAGIKTGRPQD